MECSEYIAGRVNIIDGIGIPVPLNGERPLFNEFAPYVVTNYNSRMYPISQCSLDFLIVMSKKKTESDLVKFTVYSYGYESTCKKIYDDIQKALGSNKTMDRSSSIVVEKKRELVKKFQEVHGRTLESQLTIEWSAWAAWILA